MNRTPSFLASIAVLLLLISCATPREFVPTPDMAVQFAMGSDSREWEGQHLGRTPSGGMLMEFVPRGFSIEDWDEMVAQQIEFTPQDVSAFVDTWINLLLAAAPSAAFEHRSESEVSHTVEYKAPNANELGLRRFMKGPDGIYMLAYHVRPDAWDPDIYQTWSKIIAQAQLIPNPARRR